ncbi:hypothetical protein PR048_023319 [Dryococelus australis]|uniref:Uncharacterized protein n=1 Tax=Dryococelus australis TaxID=614101 RepID=A0ABQ9GTX3_9NEOP|nr:hypothetical protein PR048_023319 [Dryococelus australis]
MEQCGNPRADETGDLRENSPASSIVRHDSHVLKSGSDPTGNRTQFALVRVVDVPIPRAEWLIKKRGGTHLDVQEVAHLEGHRAAVDGRVVVDGAVVADVGPDGEGHRLGLQAHKRRAQRGRSAETVRTIPLHPLPPASDPHVRCQTRRKLIAQRLRKGNQHYATVLLVAYLSEARICRNSWPFFSRRHQSIATNKQRSETNEGALARLLASHKPTKTNRVRFPVGSPSDFRMWESCRMMPLVGWFSQGSPCCLSSNSQNSNKFWGRGGAAARPLTSCHGEPDLNPIPDFCTLESCGTMLLVSRSSRGSPVFPTLAPRIRTLPELFMVFEAILKRSNAQFTKFVRLSVLVLKDERVWPLNPSSIASRNVALSGHRANGVV